MPGRIECGAALVSSVRMSYCSYMCSIEHIFDLDRCAPVLWKVCGKCRRMALDLQMSAHGRGTERMDRLTKWR